MRRRVCAIVALVLGAAGLCAEPPSAWGQLFARPARGKPLMPVRNPGDLPGVEEEPNAARDSGLEWISRDATYAASTIFTDPQGFVWRELPSLLTGEGPLHSLPRDDGESNTFAFHTNLENQPWITITLPEVARIERIFIEDRRVNVQAMRVRGSGMAVWVSEDGNAWEPAWRARQGEPSWSIRFPTPITARYVRVGLAGTEYLHLAAVRIYGPPIGLPGLTRQAGSDRVQMKDGSAMLGTIETKAFTIASVLGRQEVPAARVVGIVPDANQPTRVRLVLTDGQVLAGTLADGNVRLRISAQSVLDLPLADIRQAAWAISKDRPEELPARDPMVLLATGDRLACAGWEPNLLVATEYGRFEVPFRSVRSLEPVAQSGRGIRIRLHGGSEITGALPAGQLTLKLRSLGQLEIDPGDLRRFSAPGAQGPTGDSVTLLMANGDRLVGRILDEPLKIRTEFGDANLSPAHLRSWTSDAAKPGRIAVRMWDGTGLAGQLVEQTLTVVLGEGGPQATVRTAAVASMTNPAPLPPPEVRKEVERLVARLGADSYKAREAAQDALVAMGSGIAPLLKPHLGSPDPEVRTRIETILRTFDAAPATEAPRPIARELDFRRM